MAIELKTRTETVENPEIRRESQENPAEKIPLIFETIEELLKAQDRKAGHTISMLIAERRHNRSAETHAENMNRLTRRLKPHEGFLPDPFNANRRLNITRLIACIDGRR
jgi:hypothetical protein